MMMALFFNYLWYQYSSHESVAPIKVWSFDGNLVNIKEYLASKFWTQTIQGYCCLISHGSFIRTINEIGFTYATLW